MFPRLVSGLKRLAKSCFSRGGVICLLLVLVFAAAAFLFKGRRKFEPSYQSIPASVWLEMATTNSQKITDASKAFYDMGPSGAIYLGEELLSKPTKLDEWMLAHHNSIPGSLKKTLLKPHQHAKEDVILRLLQGTRHHSSFAIPMLLDWLEAQKGALNFQLVVPISSFAIHSNRVFGLGGGMFQAPLPNALVVQTASNRFQSIGIPTGGSLIIQTQMTVISPGVVTTNIIVSTHYRANSIPYQAHEILKTAEHAEPRIITQLLRPVANRSGYSSAPRFGTNLTMAALRAMPLLTQKAVAPDVDERLTAMALLKLTLPQSTTAKEIFIQALRDKDATVFEYAMVTVRPFTNDLERIIPPALEGLQRTRYMASSTMRSTEAFATLKEFVPHSPRVINGCMEILRQNPNPPDVAIVQFVGENGNTNNVDLALIGSFTNSTITLVRARAWNALGNLTGDMNAFVMEQMAWLENGSVWQSYIKLGALGEHAGRAVPKVREGLRDKEPRIVAKAAETLGRIGPAAKDALPELEALRTHPQLLVREQIEEAIRKISAESKGKASP
ncbi:MAG TPA: HEAT repeat domain-containing protein [Verrucomicrobiae bacterium]